VYADVPRRLHVQADRGLVQEQHVGVGQQAPHDVHLLAHARGELAGAAVSVLEEAHDPQQVVDAR